MQPFRCHRGLVAPLLRRDIDTDQIIPKQFLKSIERTGFGQYLFHDWRTGPDGTPDAGFVLNEPRYRDASILITGANFGCGSSREHAAWALEDRGFRAVIAPSFADIFRGNAVRNGVLPVVLPEATVTAIGARAAAAPYTLTVDLEHRRVSDGSNLDEPFDIDEAARRQLLEGLDDIGLILRYDDAIGQFERRSPQARRFAASPAR